MPSPTSILEVIIIPASIESPGMARFALPSVGTSCPNLGTTGVHPVTGEEAHPKSAPSVLSHPSGLPVRIWARRACIPSRARKHIRSRPRQCPLARPRPATLVPEGTCERRSTSDHGRCDQSLQHASTYRHRWRTDRHGAGFQSHDALGRALLSTITPSVGRRSTHSVADVRGAPTGCCLVPGSGSGGSRLRWTAESVARDAGATTTPRTAVADRRPATPERAPAARDQRGRGQRRDRRRPGGTVRELAAARLRRRLHYPAGLEAALEEKPKRLQFRLERVVSLRVLAHLVRTGHRTAA